MLVSLFAKFDLVAVQGVRGKNQGVLVHLIDQINATGRTYDFATCPTQQRDGLEHYTAFVFDCGTIEVDRSTVHFVEDPLGRIRIKPLAGSIRARGPDPAEAFTFTLINVEVDADRAAIELDLLAKAFRAVQKSRPKEDDFILLGDLQSDDQHLGELNKLFGVAPLLSGFATTARGTQLLDNMLLDRRATCEFTGRIEVVDMIREFHLTLPAARNLRALADLGRVQRLRRGRSGARKAERELTISVRKSIRHTPCAVRKVEILCCKNTPTAHGVCRIRLTAP